MRSIPALDLDDEDYFGRIAAAKHNPRRRYLNNARASVVSAYKAYSLAAPDVSNLPAIDLSAEEEEALHHAYDVPTKPFSELRGILLNRPIAARCPSCGLSEAATLDHYLPKEVHPQFSVFSKNLVPCCGPCNTRKNDRVVEEGQPVRLFLHPYFDAVSVTQFLKVDLEIVADGLLLAFRISRPAGMTKDTYTHLRSHFQLLGLGNRYRLMSLEHLRPKRRALARLYGTQEDASRVAERLREEAGDFVKEYGENYWLAVLYNALADNEEFCDGGFQVMR